MVSPLRSLVAKSTGFWAGVSALMLLIGLAGGGAGLRGIQQRRGATRVSMEEEATAPGKVDLGGGKFGFGPYYYGDMNQYGAWLGRDGKAPPFPRYSEIPADQVAKLPKPSAAYMDGFRKDYDSYFKGQVRDRPSPLETGYWPYEHDGAIATGKPGEAGKLLRSWMEEQDRIAAGDSDSASDGNEGSVDMGDYLDSELTGAYDDDMRFYTSAD